MIRTLNCIVCLTQPASSWTGYVREVRKRNHPLDRLAGFCSRHKCQAYPLGWTTSWCRPMSAGRAVGYMGSPWNTVDNRISVL